MGIGPGLDIEHPGPSQVRLLLERAERAFGQVPVGEVVGEIRAIVFENFPDGERLATEALEMLRNGQVPPLEGRKALERIIRLMRPAIVSTNGTLRTYPLENKYPPETLATWERFRVSVRPWLYSIGRIDQGEAGEGTGFLVAPDILATNRHVTTRLDFVGTVVRFKHEYGAADDIQAVPVTAVLAQHPTLDLALLRLKAPVSQPALQFENGMVSRGDSVAAIGYPFEDERNPALAHQVFQGKYGFKLASPGEVTDTSAEAIYHDCSTLGGNSGSPLLSLANARVVAMHRQGDFLDRNEAIPAPAIEAFVDSSLTSGPRS